MKKKEIQELSFSKYLDLIGAEKIDMKNEWEFARFIANEIICVIYRNKKDRISFSNESAKKIYTDGNIIFRKF